MTQREREGWRGWPWAVKVVAVAVCGLLVGIGLCGLDAHLYPGAEFGGSAFAGFGALLIAISVVALVVGVIASVVVGLMRLARK